MVESNAVTGIAGYDDLLNSGLAMKRHNNRMVTTNTAKMQDARRGSANIEHRQFRREYAAIMTRQTERTICCS